MLPDCKHYYIVICAISCGMYYGELEFLLGTDNEIPVSMFGRNTVEPWLHTLRLDKIAQSMRQRRCLVHKLGVDNPALLIRSQWDRGVMSHGMLIVSKEWATSWEPLFSKTCAPIGDAAIIGWCPWHIIADRMHNEIGFG
jgi:hypothetical protein